MDAIAFNILMFLYGLFGIQDIPNELNIDWQIVERWTEQPGQIYRLVLSSVAVIEKCKQQPGGYIAFPQTYLGQQEIYLDSYLIYSNSLSKKWNLGAVFDRPIVSCRIISHGRSLTIKIDSYLKYFAAFHDYPYLLSKYPISQFFYGPLYTFSFSVIICLGLSGAVILLLLRDRLGSLLFLVRNVLLAGMMLSYVPGFLIDIDVNILQSIFIISLWGSFLFLIKNFLFEKKDVLLVFFFCILILGAILGFYNKNFAQLISTAMLLPAIFTFSFIVFKLFSREENMSKSFFEKWAIVLITVLSAKDAYLSNISRSGFFHLSFLAIAISCIIFYKIFEKINLRKIELEKLNSRLKSEERIVSKVSASQESFREVVHDIKSPLTALSFALTNETLRPDFLIQLSNRIKEIIARIDSEHIRRSADWYSIITLCNSLIEVLEEKKYAVDKKIEYNLLCDKNNSMVFFDPVDLKVIIAEIIDNSIKYGRATIIFNIQVSLEKETCFISIVEVGGEFPERIINDSGAKGFTAGEGSGLGLVNIKRKTQEVGGSFQLTNSVEGAKFNISLRAKEA